MRSKRLQRILNKTFLIKKYLKNKKSIPQIAKEANCSIAPVYNRLIKFNIKRRTISESRIGQFKGKLNYFYGKHLYGKLNHMFGKHHTEETKEKISESHKGFRHTGETKQKMSKSHKNKKLTKQHKLNIAKVHLGMKHTKESKRKMSLGKGGTGIPYENNCYPPEFNVKLKAKIRKRDNYTCQLCNTQFDKRSSYLNVHHIDYNKMNCEEWNLITLCHQCNAKVNQNKKHWTKVLRAKNE